MKSLSRRILSITCSTRREDGQTLVEYALILMLIVLVSFVLLVSMGETVSTMLSKATTWF